jgi:hypothetical protein
VDRSIDGRDRDGFALGLRIFCGDHGYRILLSNEKSIFDLVDEVLDEGDLLIVRKGRVEDRIALADIMNVNYSSFGVASRVTLSLRKTSAFGNRVSFRLRSVSFRPFSQPPVVDELVERVDAKRRLVVAR